jgi:translation initiation factor IF-3
MRPLFLLLLVLEAWLKWVESGDKVDVIVQQRSRKSTDRAVGGIYLRRPF